MRIAILNCTKTKQTYSCSAKEMYSANYNFVDKINFIEKYYDEYYIMSVKYGIITPDTIIEPYNLTLSKDKKYLFNTGDKQINNPTKEHIEWLKSNISEFIKQYTNIDFHVPKMYYDLIQNKTNTRYIKQEKTPPNTTKYRHALTIDDFDDAILYLQEYADKHASKYNEQPKWFTHPDLGDFYGLSKDIMEKYPNMFDKGGLYRVSVGVFKQHKGWAIKRDY